MSDRIQGLILERKVEMVGRLFERGSWGAAQMLLLSLLRTTEERIREA